jgi:hypothetical protein
MRRPPGARRPSAAPRLRSGHGFGPVLLLGVASIAFAGTASDAEWTAGVLVLLQAATLVAALRTSGLARARSPLSIGLLLVSVAAAVAGLLWQGSVVSAVVGSISGALTAAIAVVVAATIVYQREVDAQSIRGAICVYLLIGMFFVFVYGVLTTVGSTPFFVQGVDATRSLRVYFSFVTLATLGYGDYTPRGDLGRLLAVLEALIGQLYLVTVIAVLVSRIGPRGRNARAR